MPFIGVDIGGTKCAVCLGEVYDDRVEMIHYCKPRKTEDYPVQEMLEVICGDIIYCKGLLNDKKRLDGIGISCGGPLNSKAGIILSPPNLPGWDNIHISEYIEEKTGVNAWLCNDANACALAEWKLGAGKGCSNMIFMTFGTGLGAGIILNGHLYAGTCDMAGELGHIRFSDYGPVGYGKMGSLEGFCSGGGIAQLAKMMILEELQAGGNTIICSSIDDLKQVTAEKVGIAAKAGDKLALKVLKNVGIQLGKGLSILIDLLNPEKIVIGSIFVRCYDEIWPWAKQVIDSETFFVSNHACQVVKSKLSEDAGNIAALMAAKYNMDLERGI